MMEGRAGMTARPFFVGPGKALYWYKLFVFLQNIANFAS